MLKDWYVSLCVGHAAPTTVVVLDILATLRDPSVYGVRLAVALDELGRCDVWTRLYAAEVVVRRWSEGALPPDNARAVASLLRFCAPDPEHPAWRALMAAVVGRERPEALRPQLEDCAAYALEGYDVEHDPSGGAAPYADLVDHRAASLVIAVLEGLGAGASGWLSRVLASDDDREPTPAQRLHKLALQGRCGRHAFVLAAHVAERSGILPGDLGAVMWKLSGDALLEPDLLEVASRLALPRGGALDEVAWLEGVAQELSGMKRLAELERVAPQADAASKLALQTLTVSATHRTLSLHRREVLVALWQGTLWGRMAAGSGDRLAATGDAVELLLGSWTPTAGDPDSAKLPLIDPPRKPRPRGKKQGVRGKKPSVRGQLLLAAFGLRYASEADVHVTGFARSVDEDEVRRTRAWLTSPWLPASGRDQWSSVKKRYRSHGNAAAMLRLLAASTSALDLLARLDAEQRPPELLGALMLHATDALRRLEQRGTTTLAGLVPVVGGRLARAGLGEGESPLGPHHFVDLAPPLGRLDAALFQRAAPASMVHWLTLRFGQVGRGHEGAGRWFGRIERLAQELREGDPGLEDRDDHVRAALLVRFVVGVSDEHRFDYLHVGAPDDAGVEDGRQEIALPALLGSSPSLDPAAWTRQVEELLARGPDAIAADPFLRLRLIELLRASPASADSGVLQALLGPLIEAGGPWDHARLMDALFETEGAPTDAIQELGLAVLPSLLAVALDPVTRPRGLPPQSPDVSLEPRRRQQVVRDRLARVAARDVDARHRKLRKRLDRARSELRTRQEPGQQVRLLRVEHVNEQAELHALDHEAQRVLGLPELLAASTPHIGSARVALKDYRTDGTHVGFAHPGDEAWSRLQDWTATAAIFNAPKGDQHVENGRVRVTLGGGGDPRSVVPVGESLPALGDRICVDVRYRGGGAVLSQQRWEPLPVAWPAGQELDAELKLTANKAGLLRPRLEVAGESQRCQGPWWVFDPIGLPTPPVTIPCGAVHDGQGWRPAVHGPVSLLLDWPAGEPSLDLVYLGEADGGAGWVFGLGAGRVYALSAEAIGEQLYDTLVGEGGKALPVGARLPLSRVPPDEPGAAPTFELAPGAAPDFRLLDWQVLLEPGELREAVRRDRGWVLELHASEHIPGLPAAVAFHGRNKPRAELNRAMVRINDWQAATATARGEFVQQNAIELREGESLATFVPWWADLQPGHWLDGLRCNGGVTAGRDRVARLSVKAWTAENLFVVLDPDSVQLGPVSRVDGSVRRQGVVRDVKDWESRRLGKLRAPSDQLPWETADRAVVQGFVLRVPAQAAETTTCRVAWYRTVEGAWEVEADDLELQGLEPGRCPVHLGDRVVATVAGQRLRIDVESRLILGRAVWRDVTGLEQARPNHLRVAGTESRHGASGDFDLVELQPGVFVRAEHGGARDQRGPLRGLGSPWRDTESRSTNQRSLRKHGGKDQALEPGIVERIVGVQDAVLSAGKYRFRTLVRLLPLGDGWYDLSKRFVDLVPDLDRQPFEGSRGQKNKNKNKNKNKKESEDERKQDDPKTVYARLLAALANREPVPCTWKVGQRHVEVTGLALPMVVAGTKNGVALRAGETPVVQPREAEVAGRVVLEGSLSSHLEASFRAVRAYTAEGLKKVLDVEPGEVVDLDPREGGSRSWKFAYAGLVELDEATGEAPPVPTHRFSWGPGLCVTVPGADLRFGDKPFGGLKNTLFHGDLVRELVFHEKPGSEEGTTRTVLEIRKVRLAYAESTRLYNQAKRHRIVHLLDVQRVGDQIRILAIRGLDGSAIDPSTAARGYNVPRALLSESSVRELLKRLEPDERTTVLGRLDSGEFELTRGRTIRFEHVHLAVGDNALRVGERLFLRLVKIERPYNEVKVFFAAPEGLLEHGRAAEVLVLRRDFAVREGLLRRVLDRDATEAVLDRLMLVKLTPSQKGLKGAIWEEADLHPRPKPDPNNWRRRKLWSSLPLRTEHALLGYLGHHDGPQLMTVAADLRKQDAGHLVLEVLPGVFARASGVHAERRFDLGDVVQVRRVLREGVTGIDVRLATYGDRVFVPKGGRSVVVLPVDGFNRDDAIEQAESPDFWRKKHQLTLGGLPGVTAGFGERQRPGQWRDLSVDDGFRTLESSKPRVGVAGWHRGHLRADPHQAGHDPAGWLDVDRDTWRLTAHDWDTQKVRPLSWREASFAETTARRLDTAIKRSAWRYHDAFTVRWVKQKKSRRLRPIRTDLPEEVVAEQGPIFFEWPKGAKGPRLRYSRQALLRLGFPVHQLFGPMTPKTSITVTVVGEHDRDHLWVEMSPGRVVALPRRLLVAQLGKKRQAIALDGLRCDALDVGDQVELQLREGDPLGLDRARLVRWRPGLRPLFGGSVALLPVRGTDVEDGAIRLGVEGHVIVLPMSVSQAERRQDHGIAVLQPDNFLQTFGGSGELYADKVKGLSALLVVEEGRLRIAGLPDHSVSLERDDPPWRNHPLRPWLQRDPRSVVAAAGGALPVTIELLHQRDARAYVSLRHQALPGEGLDGVAPAVVLGALDGSFWLVRAGRWLLPLRADAIVGGLPQHHTRPVVDELLVRGGGIRLWVRSTPHGLVSGVRHRMRRFGPARLLRAVSNGGGEPIGFLAQDPATMAVHWLAAEHAGWSGRFVSDAATAEQLLRDSDGWVRGAFERDLRVHGGFSVIHHPEARAEFDRLAVGEGLNVTPIKGATADSDGRVVVRSQASGVWLDCNPRRTQLAKTGSGVVVTLRNRGDNERLETHAGRPRPVLNLPADFAACLADPTLSSPGLVDAAEWIAGWRAAYDDRDDGRAKWILDQLGLRAARSLHLEVLADVWLTDPELRERRDGVWPRLAGISDRLFAADRSDDLDLAHDVARLCRAIRTHSSLARDTDLALIGAGLEVVLGRMPTELRLLRKHAEISSELLWVTQLEPPEPGGWAVRSSVAVRDRLAAVLQQCEARREQGRGRLLLMEALPRFGRALLGAW